MRNSAVRAFLRGTWILGLTVALRLGAASAQTPQGRVLSADELHRIGTEHCGMQAYSSSRDGEKLTFGYGCDVQNETNLQLSEVDLALAFIDQKTLKEHFRSAPIRLSEFDNRRLPHLGALESGSSLASAVLQNFVAPSDEWRTNVSLRVIPVRAVAAPEPVDLHDIGNLIQFMRTRSENDVLQAFDRDPGLVSARDSKGTTPFLVAMAYGTPAVVRAIVAKGGNIHSKASSDEDALFYAIAGDNPANLQLARDMGFTPTRALPNGETTLQRAISQRAERSVEWLTTHGADLNELDSMGFVPLMQAIYWHDASAFDLLVKGGADVFRRSRSQLTIMEAAAVFDANFLSRALELGLDIDDRVPPNDVTPLMLAAQTQNNRSAIWLLDHGANGKSVAKNGWGVLDFAQQSNTLHTETFFLNAVGDPTKWHAKYPPKEPGRVTPPAAPIWRDGVLRFDCALASFESELPYSPPIRGALQQDRYTINPHLRTPFDLHEWSTACAETSSHSPVNPNIVFCHVAGEQSVVWKTTVKVEPNARYVFACWAYGVADPLQCHSSLILRINGLATERSYVPFSNWGKSDSVWASGAATSATLEIVSAKEIRDHIFGISDVSLTKVP